MKYKVTINGTTYEVEVEQGEAVLVDSYAAPVAAVVAAAPTAPAAPAPAAPVTAAPAPVAAAPAAPVAGGETIAAPMPGTIVGIKVAAGQAVKKGDLLIILEAMKMENEIVASRDGTVAQVIAVQGTNVDTGAPLLVLA